MFYFDFKQQVFWVCCMKLVDGYVYMQEELIILEGQYMFFLDEFGYNKVMVFIILEFVELQVIYMNKLDSVIKLLVDMINYFGINFIIQVRGKLVLVDYYLMDGDIWEVILFYFQVDKVYKEDIFGYEVCFCNV